MCLQRWSTHRNILCSFRGSWGWLAARENGLCVMTSTSQPTVIILLKEAHREIHTVIVWKQVIGNCNYSLIKFD